MQRIEHNHSFGGWHSQYQHPAKTVDCDMRFAIYLPPQANPEHPVPVLYWLSGLTCNQENFMQKAGAQRVASELGIAIVAPDTSPRGAEVADNEAYDLGQGAGFYVNATQAPWSKHYHMYDYIVDELPQLIEQHFPVNNRRSISGHSMGGHGALMIALRNPIRYLSSSAFAPICQPTQVPWGQKAFQHYLGNATESWDNYDTCHLIQHSKTHIPMRIDQGLQDEWLQTQLHLDVLAKTANENNYPVEIQRHPEYDHNYYFVASFIEEHLRFHSLYLS